MQCVFLPVAEQFGHIKILGDKHVVTGADQLSIEIIVGIAVHSSEVQDNFLIRFRYCGDESGFVPPFVQFVLLFSLNIILQRVGVGGDEAVAVLSAKRKTGYT